MAHKAPMISVVIPTLNAEPHLVRTLAALVPAAVDGIVKEAIIVDGGSTDETPRIAEQAGARLLTCRPSRGGQLKTAAQEARFPWLLFLHADTVLEPGWLDEAGEHIARIDEGRRSDTAGVFRFTLDDSGFAPRIIEKGVSIRSRLLALPYGDQGLLISHKLYDTIGGFSDMPIMEDVDIVRRLGRKRITQFRSAATTSADRYRADGYTRRISRNLCCLALYGTGVSPERIVSIYEG